MKFALILNGFIVTAVLACMWVTNNPLALVGLAFLKDMPYGLMIDEIQANNGSLKPEPEVNDYQGTGIGFVQDEEQEE